MAISALTCLALLGVAALLHFAIRPRTDRLFARAEAAEFRATSTTVAPITTTTVDPLVVAAQLQTGPVAMTPSVPRVALATPSEMPPGNSWDVPIPVSGPQVWHTASEQAPTGKVVALTFDDGPAPQTRQIADILTAQGIPATFFQIGDQVRRDPETTRYLHSKGFGLGAHTMTHPQLTKIAEDQLPNEILQSAAAIDAAVGQPVVQCLRPPYGAWNLATAKIAGSFGLAVVNWTTDTDDYDRPPVDDIVTNALANQSDSLIILMHDGPDKRENTVAALPRIIEGLKAKGYTFVRVC